MESSYVLIVSTGRTGTTYLDNVLSMAGFDVRQEAAPSWPIYLLSNLAARFPRVAGPAQGLATGTYRRSRRAWLARAAGPVIEINPFLSNLVPEIAVSSPRPTGVIHIVREPISWVRSMIRFGAYAWRRPLVRVLPFVYYRPPGRADWSQLSLAQRLGHEWLYRNRQILAADTDDMAYVRLCYEDLFDRGGLDTARLHRTLETVGLTPPQPLDPHAMHAPTNTSDDRPDPAPLTDAEVAYIREVTSPLARTFGYV